MSALLGHVKACRVLARSFRAQASAAAGVPEQIANGTQSILHRFALAYDDAANVLAAKATEECTGPGFEDRPQPQKGKRT